MVGRQSPFKLSVLRLCTLQYKYSSLTGKSLAAFISTKSKAGFSLVRGNGYSALKITLATSKSNLEYQFGDSFQFVLVLQLAFN